LTSNLVSLLNLGEAVNLGLTHETGGWELTARTMPVDDDGYSLCALLHIDSYTSDKAILLPIDGSSMAVYNGRTATALIRARTINELNKKLASSFGVTHA
jgi:hypothetical protein